MNGRTLEARENPNWTGSANDAGDVVDFAEPRTADRGEVPHRKGGFFGLISELRRRKVCRAATAYCIALWLTCQVVEVVSEPMGLPEWTLQMVIVLGLVGFPIALIFAWLFEVTPNGLVLDNESTARSVTVAEERPRSRFDQVIDCSLLLVAIVIGLQIAITSFGAKVMASPVPTEDIYVTPFTVVAKTNADSFSGALQVELQHEMRRLPNIKVVVPIDERKKINGSSLSGSVAVTDKEIQVTAIVVRNLSGELAWSKVMLFSIKESGGTPRSIAKGVVTALEDWSVSGSIVGGQDG